MLNYVIWPVLGQSGNPDSQSNFKLWLYSLCTSSMQVVSIQCLIHPIRSTLSLVKFLFLISTNDPVFKRILHEYVTWLLKYSMKTYHTKYALQKTSLYAVLTTLLMGAVRTLALCQENSVTTHVLFYFGFQRGTFCDKTKIFYCAVQV